MSTPTYEETEIEVTTTQSGHRLNLTTAQAYQIWRLSWFHEGGDGHPVAPGSHPRVVRFFPDEMHTRFRRWAIEGRHSPLSILELEAKGELPE